MFCGHCGEKLKEDSQFCGKCGKRINVQNIEDKNGILNNKLGCFDYCNIKIIFIIF